MGRSTCHKCWRSGSSPLAATRLPDSLEIDSRAVLRHGTVRRGVERFEETNLGDRIDFQWGQPVGQPAQCLVESTTNRLDGQVELLGDHFERDLLEPQPDDLALVRRKSCNCLQELAVLLPPRRASQRDRRKGRRFQVLGLRLGYVERQGKVSSAKVEDRSGRF